MKKMKRILAWIGILVLLGLYLSTLIFAIIGSPEALQWLKASVLATIIVPILLYGYLLIFRLQKKEEKNEKRDDSK